MEYLDIRNDRSKQPDAVDRREVAMGIAESVGLDFSTANTLKNMAELAHQEGRHIITAEQAEAIEVGYGVINDLVETLTDAELERRRVAAHVHDARLEINDIVGLEDTEKLLHDASQTLEGIARTLGHNRLTHNMTEADKLLAAIPDSDPNED